MNTLNNNFTVLSASAGSGKTFRLATEYLKIALSTNNEYFYQSILAVTFTNKAAEELKHRILKFLNQLAYNENKEGDDLYTIAFSEETTSFEVIQQRAKKCLQNILNNYGRFSVSTIDKFSQRIIRAFAKDFSLDPKYLVELDLETVANTISNQILQEIGVKKELTTILEEWAKKRIKEEENTRSFAEDISGFTRLLFSEEATLYSDKLKRLKTEDFDYLEQVLTQHINSYEEEISATAKAILSRVKNNGYTPTDFKGKSTSAIVALEKAVSKKPFILTEAKWNNFKNPETIAGKNDEHLSFIQSIFNETSAFITCENEKGNTARLSKLLLKDFYLIQLVNKIENRLYKLKKEERIVLISDVNKLISEVVLQEPSPFIYEKIGIRYTHYLIDEFQDTSLLQWQNFLPLVTNCLGLGGKVLLVGDPKQAIYRFRGGEQAQMVYLQSMDSLEFPKQLNPLKNELVDEHYQQLPSYFKAEELSSNYRSLPNIISFNNHTHKLLNGYIEKPEIFEKGIQQIPEGKEYKQNGRAEVFPIESANTDEFKESALQLLKKRITVLLEEGKYQLQDIAILVNKKREGKEAVQFLLEHNLNAVSNESLLVTKSPIVQGILGLLWLEQKPEEPNGIYHLLNYFQHIKTDSEIPFLAESLTLLVKDGERKKRVLNRQAVEDLLGKKIPKQHWFTDTYSYLGALQNILSTGDKPDVFLQFFMEESLQQITRGQSCLQVLEFWHERGNKISISLPENIDAIRVMTIHASKGLEFPCVFVPFLNWNTDAPMSNTKDYLWFEASEYFKPLETLLLPFKKDLKDTAFGEAYDAEKERNRIDTANKFYVANTRASDFLSLFVYDKPLSSNSKGDSGKGRIDLAILNNLENADWITNETIDGAACYALGSIPENLREQVAAPNFIELKQTNNTYFEEKIKLVYQLNNDDDITSKARETGELAHQILSEINNIKQLNKALQKRVLKGLLNQEEAEKLNTSLTTLLKLGKEEGWFGEGDHFNEHSIADFSSGEAEIKRPDKVLVTESEVWLIDYKTGEESSKHIKQLAGYEKCLLEMGYSNIKKKVVYFKV